MKVAGRPQLSSPSPRRRCRFELLNIFGSLLLLLLLVSPLAPVATSPSPTQLQPPRRGMSSMITAAHMCTVPIACDL